LSSAVVAGIIVGVIIGCVGLGGGAAAGFYMKYNGDSEFNVANNPIYIDKGDNCNNPLYAVDAN